MSLTKKEIVKILNEISIFYELKNENFFKIRAYDNASRALEVSDIDLNPDTPVEELKKIKGIGSHIAGQIQLLAADGKLQLYEDLKKSIPAGLIEMLKIPTLGPKKIKYLFENLSITNTGELEFACVENRLVNLPGFGTKTQENILKGIELVNKFKEKYLYANVADEAQKIINKLSKFKQITRLSIAGSLRRKKEIIKDIDIVASTDHSEKVMDFFTKLEAADGIIAKGETKSSIRLKSGINADLRAVSDLQYPYALHHFTGSKEHNTAMRTMAKKSGIKMNEYGLFENDKLIKCASEKDIFTVFSMDYIPPELRENTGEIEAARKKKLPKLINEEDLKGLFHFHTTSSDGNMSLEQVCIELKNMGFEYGGIADHSKTASYASGIKEADIDVYLENIDIINKKQTGFKIFKGIESDILPDGGLDYNDEILEKFDFVIIAIHSNFNMPEKQMTDRIINAMRNKYATMLAHPTGRLLLARDPYNIDIKKIIDAASEFFVDLEINASPF
ncbi:MAG: DNA polymerase/3'-5' exonuclease PolX, partial [Actinobacteria bacterium]|nr:DNA polymerase/3'-5' exonuclease PolX [Actinomycetota bacterium]